MKLFIGQTFLAALAVLLTVHCSYAQQQEVTVESVAEKAIEYLRTTGKADDGSYSSFAGPAVTALVTTAMLQHGVPATDTDVAASLNYLKGFIQPDGGIYSPESVYKNYETSIALLCFAEANADGQYDEILKKAVQFTKNTQWGAGGRSVEESDDRYGGFGYGKHERPDLSNTSYAIDALIKAGVDPESPEMQRALKFVSRSQNHESAHNDLPNASKNPDGGFFYTPANGGESKAESVSGGGLRSYGSMTYAGLKSLLYAGVNKDDSRVKAAVTWIQANYDLQANPGMGAEGLFYYYHVFAKALDAIGEDNCLDAEGESHDWRKELLDELSKRQASDGSWTNQGSDRWLEGDPNLVTAYALLALKYCKK